MNRSSNLETAFELPPSPFTQITVNANPSLLDDFDSWIFHHGMLFGAPDKWWGDFGQRDFPHEGLDFCLYRDRSDHKRRLDTQTRIPVMFDGVVRAVFKDYLGQAIVVEHAIPVHGKTVNIGLLTIYAHTDPLEGVKPGQRLHRGDIIATIAGTRRSKANILPHLHLSVAIPVPDLTFDGFVWNIMRDPARITLLNPMDIFACRQSLNSR
jgi:murein DD-endopeptidase MepM/ murein hydrolase activator NlpD